MFLEKIFWGTIGHPNVIRSTVSSNRFHIRYCSILQSNSFLTPGLLLQQSVGFQLIPFCLPSLTKNKSYDKCIYIGIQLLQLELQLSVIHFVVHTFSVAFFMLIFQGLMVKDLWGVLSSVCFCSVLLHFSKRIGN